MTRSKVAVLYHRRCADGQWAGACVLAAEELRHELALAEDDVFVFGMQYGDALTPETVRSLSADVLYIVDYSVAPDELVALAESCGRVVWIDHHKTAMDRYGGIELPPNVHAILDVARSGAVIAYEEVLRPVLTGVQGDQTTLPVYYVADRDLWTWALPDSQAVNMGMGSWAADMFAGLPEHAQVRKLATMLRTTSDWTALLSEWKTAGRAQLVMQRRLVRDARVTRLPTMALAAVVDAPWAAVAHRLLPYGHVVMVNSGMLQSEIGSYLATATDIACIFNVSLRDARVTMAWRSKNGEAVQIAEAMGGGGHPNAAGAAMSISDFFSVPWSVIAIPQEEFR